MKYINNIFTVEKSKLTKVINKFETPIFCYSEKKINDNINIQVFQVNEKMKLKPIDFSSYVIDGKVSLSFIESDLRNLVFRIEQFKAVDSLQFQLNFHNSNIVKPPFFNFYKSKKMSCFSYDF